MTQEKDLLLRDLCARLPYGVKIRLSRKHNRPEENIVLNNVIVNKDGFVVFNIIGYNYLLSEIKPYLRPMSSMTKEEENEWWEFNNKNTIVETHSYSIDWLNSHHFDYRNLIERGLAIKAPEGMYKI